MRKAYLETLYNLAYEDKNVLSLVSDNGLIVYDDFRKSFPEQYFNFGMSEGHMVTAACGLASCGKIPFIYTINAFLAFRSFEFIRVDACLNNLNIKIIGIGSGFAYGYLGPTHHATEDISVLRALPNLTILSPSTPLATKACVKLAYQIKGPVYVRMGTNNEKEFYDKEIKPFSPNLIKKGEDFTIVSTGSILQEVIQVADLLEKEEILVNVIDINCLKPFPSEEMAKLLNKTKKVFTIEEHNIIGGLGTIIAECIALNEIQCQLVKIGLEDKFAKGYGTYPEMREQNKLDSKNILKEIKKFI